MNKLRQMARTVGTLAIIWGITSPSLAQTSASQPQAAPRWVVNCSNVANPDILACSLSMTLFQAETRQKVLSATVFQGPEGTEMAMNLPHGLDLPSGIVVAVDQGAGQTYAIQTSNADGAYSRFALTGSILEALRKGNTMFVDLTASNKNAIRIELPLKGISQGLDMALN